MPPLASLGYGPFFDAQIAPAERASLLVGRAVEDRGPRLLVRFEDGERLVVLPRRLRSAGGMPVVGDFVLAQPAAEPVVVRVLARRTRLSRGASGRGTVEQVLAANVDVVAAVAGLDAGVNARRIERTVAAIHGGGAEPAIVLAKADLAPDLAEALSEVRAAAPGVRVVAVSARTGEGLDRVRALVAPGRTAVFTGPSGAGKSTLVNALLGAEVQATKEVRSWDRRGRHATTGRRLLDVPGAGAIIDGPGLRELQLWDAGGIDEAFGDVASLAAGCRFRDCSHVDEPGCAVRAAEQAGALDPERLASFLKLGAEARASAARRLGAARAGKELRRLQKTRGR